MTPARLQRIEEIFYAALDQEPDHINAFLETTCGGDEVVRRKVEVLLASRQRVGGFIETSAAGIATRIIGTGQADLLVGQTFGHYKISKRIGIGGMGEVYLATDIVAGRKAALKLLPMRFTGDAERLKRFRQEAHAVVALNHPNILTVYEIGEDHSTHYIASELIEGETLRQRLTRGRMELSEAIDVAIQVAGALAAAHEAGIVHRDINPGNIMLRPDGYVKVLDFGIAKLAESAFAKAAADGAGSMTLAETNLGSILGTVPYMSPEQACGAAVDKRTDIWSLGLVLYEMVTGHAPFPGDTPSEVMTSILKKEPPPLGSYVRHSPGELQQIISKTLRKDRTERYQSASEMLQALKNLHHKLELKAELERSAAPLWLRWIRSPITLAVLLFLLTALALGVRFYWHQSPATSSPPEKSIAVLPFQNLSRDPDNAYFADGIQEEILTRLASIADLKVISRSSAQEYQSKPRNLREIAKQLGVANVLEGSVQRTADRVHINVQLIKAASDAHVWAEAYDRKLTDIFAVESEIAKTIAETLQAKLTGSEQRAIATRPTENTEAHQLYLKGRFFWNKRTSDGMMKSIDYFARAIEKDPAYGLAYAGLADAYTILPNYSQTPWNESYPRAKAAVLKALEINDNVAEAHIALANLKLWNDWAQGAEEEFKRGIELSPSYATGHHWYSIYLSAMGRHQEAIAEMTKAQELDPFSLIINTQLGLPYLYARAYDRAIMHFQKAIEMDPNFAFAHFALAEAYDRKGRYEDALAEHDKSIALAGEPSQAWLAMTGLLKDTYQTLGGKDYWQKRLEVTRKLYDEHAVTPKAVAEIYAVVGDKEQALGWLEKSYQEHDRFLVFLKVQSEFDTLRGDPRFEALIAKVFSAQKSPTQSQ